MHHTFTNNKNNLNIHFIIIYFLEDVIYIFDIIILKTLVLRYKPRCTTMIVEFIITVNVLHIIIDYIFHCELNILIHLYLNVILI